MAHHSASCLVFLGIIILEASSLQLHPAFRNCFGTPYYTQQPYPAVYQPPRYPDPPPQYYSKPSQAPPIVDIKPEAPKPVESLSSSALTSSPILQALNTSIVNSTTGKIDTELLGNLAVALQLLIVNNILTGAKDVQNLTLAENIETSTPPTVVPPSVPFTSLMPIEDYKCVSAAPYEQSKVPNHGQFPPAFPDAKFIGRSSFGDCGSSIYSGAFIPPHVPRTGHSLKSPYEALASPPSPFDKYTPNFKTDFQSPYAVMMNPETCYTNDLFSL